MTGLREKYIGCLPAVTFVRRAADGAPLKEREKQMSLSVQHLQFNTTTLFNVDAITLTWIVLHYFLFLNFHFKKCVRLSASRIFFCAFLCGVQLHQKNVYISISANASICVLMFHYSL